MIRMLIVVFCFVFVTPSNSQIYFPPNNSTVWDTISPASLNWCQNKIDSLYSFLDTSNTKSFILLKDGKIVLEKYFNNHSDTSYWYWASAGKTITSFLIGIAQEESYLDVADTTSNYLGYGWTSCDSLQEQKITIWNQLTMTTGLNDNFSFDCTNDTCLEYLSDPGTRWAYHNAPYTLLRPVLENATGKGINLYNYQKLLNPIGMDGIFIYSGYNNIFNSTSRSMARFGLLILNNGNWNGNQIMSDTNYFNQMLNTSQMFNESYGYLWWLNGKSSYMLPGGSQFVFNNELTPNAPNDLISALGKNGQLINIVPSQNLVWIRMGEDPDSSFISSNFNIDVWSYINELACGTLSIEDYKEDERKLVNITDILGRESKEIRNQPLFYIYDDGTVEKKIILK